MFKKPDSAAGLTRLVHTREQIRKQQQLTRTGTSYIVVDAARYHLPLDFVSIKRKKKLQDSFRSSSRNTFMEDTVDRYFCDEKDFMYKNILLAQCFQYMPWSKCFM